MINIAMTLFCLGAALFLPACIWALVLAWRASGAWFIGMLFLGYLLYPFLAYGNWQLMRRNAFALGMGFILMAMGSLTLLALH